MSSPGTLLIIEFSLKSEEKKKGKQIEQTHWITKNNYILKKNMLEENGFINY